MDGKAPLPEVVHGLPDIPSTLEAIIADTKSPRWHPEDARQFIDTLGWAAVEMKKRNGACTINEVVEAGNEVTLAMMIVFGMAMRYFALDMLKETLEQVTGIVIPAAQPLLTRGSVHLDHSNAEFHQTIARIMTSSREDAPGSSAR